MGRRRRWTPVQKAAWCGRPWRTVYQTWGNDDEDEDDDEAEEEKDWGEEEEEE